MQLTANSPVKATIRAEIYTRLLIGLFMFLCFILAKVVLSPIDDGDVKLIMTGLIEIAMMVILAIFSGRSSIVRDMNELNCYALLTHLVYLPAFYLNVMPTFHNNAINFILFLVVARLIYFGPRTANGDFKGLPVFGLLGHVQAIIDEKRNSKLGRLFNHLPSMLFFGSSIPIWIVIARSNDLVITSSIIGLMLFIFAMAQRIHNLLEMQYYKGNVLAAKEMPTDTVILEMDQIELKDAIYDFSLKVISDYHRFHFAAQTGLNPINIYRAKLSLVPLPKQIFSLDEQRRGLLDSVECIGLIAKWQLDLKAGLNSTIQVRLFKDRLAALQDDFKREFGDELKYVEIEKYAYIASQTKSFEISDEELHKACDALMMAWLVILFRTDDECLGKIDLLHKILHKLSAKFRPENQE